MPMIPPSLYPSGVVRPVMTGEVDLWCFCPYFPTQTIQTPKRSPGGDCHLAIIHLVPVFVAHSPMQHKTTIKPPTLSSGSFSSVDKTVRH